MIRKLLWCALVVSIVGDTLVSTAYAVNGVPELDPASAGGAIALLVAAGMMLRDRLARR